MDHDAITLIAVYVLGFLAAFISSLYLVYVPEEKITLLEILLSFVVGLLSWIGFFALLLAQELE